jgi:hypothetical protein
MLEAWAVPFGERFRGRPGISICELSLVESAVSCWVGVVVGLIQDAGQ